MECARKRATGGEAILRLAGGGSSGDGGWSAGICGERRPVPGERDVVLPGQPVSAAPAGGTGDRRSCRGGRHGISMPARGCFRCRWPDGLNESLAVEAGRSAGICGITRHARGARVEAVAEQTEVFLAKAKTAPDFVLADPPRAGLGKAAATRLAELRPADAGDCGVRSGDAGAGSGCACSRSMKSSGSPWWICFRRRSTWRRSYGWVG